MKKIATLLLMILLCVTTTTPVFAAEKEEEDVKTQNATKKNVTVETVMYTNEEVKLLACLIQAEAGNQSFRGKVAVGNVVLNRVKCKNEFGNNVADVVFERTNGVYQFSPVQDGRYWSVSISDKTREAVHRVLCGEDESQGALYFMARQYADADNVVWFDSSLSYLFAYGEHEFFS